MAQHNYLIHLQYLGFRYHGWLKQPGQLTVQKMVDKTIAFVLGHTDFKTIACSRTDAKVSALHTVIELFMQVPLESEAFLADLNVNLPSDIRAIAVEEAPDGFNIIQSSKTKEYLYLFAFGEKAHPFATSVLSCFQEPLNLSMMMEGAKLFEGTHDFRAYIAQSNDLTNTMRTVDYSGIEENKLFEASFFPKNTYLFRLRSKGFGRYQVRMMMGQLVALGKGKINLDKLKASLQSGYDENLREIAPGSGLILNRVEFD